MVNPTETKEEIETKDEMVEPAPEPDGSLMQAITTGAADACSAAGAFLPATGRYLRKGVYSAFYYASYGVVFGSLVFGSLIPSNNVMGEGVHDGVEAARKAFQDRQDALIARESVPAADEAAVPA